MYEVNLKPYRKELNVLPDILSYMQVFFKQGSMVIQTIYTKVTIPYEGEILGTFEVVKAAFRPDIITVSTYKDRVMIGTYEAEPITDVEEVDDIVTEMYDLDMPKLKEMAKHLFEAKEAGLRPFLGGICFRGGTAFATDAHTLVCQSMPQIPDGILPYDSALFSLTDVKIGQADKFWVLKTGNIEYSITADGSIPDFNSVIPKTNPQASLIVNGDLVKDIKALKMPKKELNERRILFEKAEEFTVDVFLQEVDRKYNETKRVKIRTYDGVCEFSVAFAPKYILLLTKPLRAYQTAPNRAAIFDSVFDTHLIMPILVQ